MARPHGPWTINDNDAWMLWTGQYVLEWCTTATHGTSFTWTCSRGSSYLGLYVADSEEYNPGRPRCADHPGHPRPLCGTAGVPRPGQTFALYLRRSSGTTWPENVFPGPLRPTGSYRRASSPQVASACWCQRLGQPRRSIYCAKAGKSRCLSLGAPGRLLSIDPPHPAATLFPTVSVTSPHFQPQWQRRSGRSDLANIDIPLPASRRDQFVLTIAFAGAQVIRPAAVITISMPTTAVWAPWHTTERWRLASSHHAFTCQACMPISTPNPKASLVGKVVRTPSPGPHRASPSRLHQQVGMPCNVRARC